MLLRTITGRDKVTRVYIVESYRDEHGKTKQRTVESLGRLDQMLAEDPDAWEKARVHCEELTAAKKATRGRIEYDTAQPWDGARAVNLGWLLIDALLRRLGVVQVARAGRGRNGATTGVDVASVTRLLVASRVTWPGSKLKAWERQADLLLGPRIEAVGDVYQGLDDIASLACRFQQAARRGLGAAAASLDTVDYDVTNYFFHIDTADPAPLGTTAKRGQASREQGYSKEHRPDPIIQMGLFLDGDGIPVSYRLFDGNVPDMSTMTTAVSEFKAMFTPAKIVMVADKGLNTGPNLIDLAEHHDGWIVGASHRKDTATRAWLLDDAGWVWNREGSAKHKSRVITHTITALIGTARRSLEVTEKYVASWSREAEARDHATRADLLAKAARLAGDESAYRAGGKRGPRKYILAETIDPATGELTTRKQVGLTVNQGLAEAEALLDGYHLVRTSETHLDDQVILERYHQLWQIEHAFRVSKTNLETRPVYVHLPQRIEAHFLICFLSLLVTRLLQRLTGLSSAQLVRAIQSFQAMPCGNGVYRLQRPDWEAIDQATGVALNQSWATIDQIRAWATALATTIKTHPLTT